MWCLWCFKKAALYLFINLVSDYFIDFCQFIKTCGGYKRKLWALSGAISQCPLIHEWTLVFRDARVSVEYVYHTTLVKAIKNQNTRKNLPGITCRMFRRRTEIPSLDRRHALHKQQKILNYVELSDNETLIGSFFNAGNKCTRAIVEFKPALTH